jgi:hypothetical protein
MNFRFGFFGSRKGMTRSQHFALREVLKSNSGEFHHGDSIGADAEAHDIAFECGYAIVIHPPLDRRLRAFKAAPELVIRPEQQYLIRNKEIVLETMALIAVPFESDEQRRCSTWAAYRFARTSGRATVLILPGGEIRQHRNHRNFRLAIPRTQIHMRH